MNRRSRRALAASLLIVLFVAVSAAWAGQPKARNIILMISDGCGYNSVAAAGYYQYGQLGKQPYDSFPARFACTTYALKADGNPQGYDPVRMWADFDYARSCPRTDSAAAATALMTGAKTVGGRICTDISDKPLTTIGQLGDAAGKSTGTVTTVQFSDATPACVWAHNRSRSNTADIAKEMVCQSGLDVIMGAGHPDFDNDGKSSARKSFQAVGGDETWADITDSDGANGFTLVQTKAEFQALATGTKALPKKVLGVAQVRDALQCNRDGKDMGRLNDNVPDLATMAKGAINVLSQDKDGFFVMIEGGAIDKASHSNNLPRMIEEEVDFNKAVEAVVQWVEQKSNWNETLLIVTADHETGMLWGAGTFDDMNGDGKYTPGTDAFKTWAPVRDAGVGVVPGCQYCSGDHTNFPVPLYAKGPGSELFATLVDGKDPVYGPYVDDTDVFTVMDSALTGKGAGRSGPSTAAASAPVAAGAN